MEGSQSKQGFSSFLDTDVGKIRGEEEGGREKKKDRSETVPESKLAKDGLAPVCSRGAETPYLEAAVLIK